MPHPFGVIPTAPSKYLYASLANNCSIVVQSVPFFGRLDFCPVFNTRIPRDLP